MERCGHDWRARWASLPTTRGAAAAAAVGTVKKRKGGSDATGKTAKRQRGKSRRDGSNGGPTASRASLCPSTGLVGCRLDSISSAQRLHDQRPSSRLQSFFPSTFTST